MKNDKCHLAQKCDLVILKIPSLNLDESYTPRQILKLLNTMKTSYQFDMESKSLSIRAIVTATIIFTMTGVLSYATGQVSDAVKMASMGGGPDYGNKSYGAHGKVINGTIDLEQTIFQAIGAKVNTTLTQAITTAEQTIGNNSFAMAAFGGPYGSYLVYTIILGTPTMEFHKVIIDPGTGLVLSSEQMSQKEWMKMQQMHHMMHGEGPGGGGMGMMFMEENGKPMKLDRGWK